MSRIAKGQDETDLRPGGLGRGERVGVVMGVKAAAAGGREQSRVEPKGFEMTTAALLGGRAAVA